MGLLHLVEQDDAVGPAPDGLGQHAALAVADVARRRALQRRDLVLLLELRHVDRDHVPLAAVERLGERDGGLGLADAARADQQEDADRPARIGQVRARGADPLRDRLEGVRLADDALLEPLLQREDGADLVGHHLADRDAGPAGDDLGDGLRVDADLHERRLALQRLELLVERVELGPERCGSGGGPRRRGAAGAAPASRRSRRPSRRRLLLRSGQVLQLRPRCRGSSRPARVSSSHCAFRPARLSSAAAFVAVELVEPLLVVGARAPPRARGCSISAVQLVDRAAAQSSTAGGVAAWPIATRAQAVSSTADRLVGQLPAGDVAVREPHGVLDGLVEDAHLVVLLERARRGRAS